MDTRKEKADLRAAASWAAERILRQAETPVSPCSVDETGKISLCAAAAVAAGGLELSKGRNARIAFERDLAASGMRELVYVVFGELGWGTETCSQKMRFNDIQPPDARRTRVLEYLQNFATSNAP